MYNNNCKGELTAFAVKRCHDGVTNSLVRSALLFIILKTLNMSQTNYFKCVKCLHESNSCRRGGAVYAQNWTTIVAHFNALILMDFYGLHPIKLGFSIYILFTFLLKTTELITQRDWSA